MDKRKIRLYTGFPIGVIFVLSLVIFGCTAPSSVSERDVSGMAVTPTMTNTADMVSESDRETLLEEITATPMPTATPIPTPTPEIVNVEATEEVSEAESATQPVVATLAVIEAPESEGNHLPGIEYVDLPPPSQWQEWPVLPVVSEAAWQIYQQGILDGRNVNAVSVFGDCQSVSEVFWGVFDTSNYEWADEDTHLAQTVEWYHGSFGRDSVTTRSGTTAAAILWEQWIPWDDETCWFGETPLECEVRINNPTIVLISVGTHWELRNERYLRRILDQLIEMGILPVIATKADQREGKEGWVNQQMVEIAQEYQLPVWNFWLRMQDFENGGLIEGDPMMLTDEALAVRRLSGLEALHAIRLQLVNYQENN